MAKSVYMLVLGHDYTEAWHQLSKEEQAELWSKVDAVDKAAGAKTAIACDSRWADESLIFWAVVEYPDMEAYQRKAKELEALNWWRYFSAKTILGTKMEE
jgi:hypothetical protein